MYVDLSQGDSSRMSGQLPILAAKLNQPGTQLGGNRTADRMRGIGRTLRPGRTLIACVCQNGGCGLFNTMKDYGCNLMRTWAEGKPLDTAIT